MSSETLRMESVSFSYSTPSKGGRRYALEAVTLSLHAGQSLGILGGNGSGKTTLLHLVAGFFVPHQGIVMRSKSFAAVTSVSGANHLDLTLVKNLQFADRLLNGTRTASNSKLYALLEEVGLLERASDRVRFLSSGERLRLSLCSLNLIRAKLLSLDEWISAGDRGARGYAEEVLERVTKSAGSIIFATHSKDVFFRNADRAIVLDEGKMTFSGPPEQAWEIYSAR